MEYPVMNARNMVLLSQIKEIENELQFNSRRYSEEELEEMDRFRRKLYDELEMG